MTASALLAVAEARERSDPLARFRFRCDGQRALARWVAHGIEAHAHAPNGAGKTIVSQALAVALCRGERQIDGVTLPGLISNEPWVHWLGVPTRRQQVDASQKALLTMVGDWPHTVSYASKANDYIETVRIKPNVRGWSDDPATWSRVTIHCEASGLSLPGGRVHSVNWDEPPAQSTWAEVRARWMAGIPLRKWIAETPLQRSRWWWLFNDAAGFRNCLDRERDGRVAVNWGLAEVHGAAQVARLERDYAGDPLAKARLTGWPVDDETSAPFSGKALALWRAKCVPPHRVAVKLFLESEDESDRETLAQEAAYEYWTERHPLGVYALVGDPSAGIQDGHHDPSGFHVVEEIDPALVARYSGFLDGYSFGWLAGTVARGYNTAEAFIETQGGSGYGGEAIRALRRMRYPKIGHDRLANAPDGKPQVRYGFSTTESTRKEYIAAIQGALSLEAAGRPVIKIWSEAVVDCLADAMIDRKSGKVVASPGGHLEDMICLGYALKRLGLPKKLTPRQHRELDPVGEALRREFGRDIRPWKSPRNDVPEAFRK